jgi:hypothetical protein
MNKKQRLPLIVAYLNHGSCIGDHTVLLQGLVQQAAQSHIFSSGHVLITLILCIIIGMLGNIRL